MQDKRGSEVSSRKAADRGTIAGSSMDDDARWRVATELVQAMRNSGYKCELLVEKDLQ
jgi:hypothetical protein